MKEMKSLKVNAILNILRTVSNIIFPLITFPYVSRVLGPTYVGKVNFGSSFVSYFSLIASLGITTYAIRECSTVKENKDKLEKIASEIYSINICTSVAAYILLAFFLIFFRELDNYRTLIIIQSTGIMLVTWGADWLNSAMEDFRYITIRSIVFQLLSVIMMIIFVRNPQDYMKYAAITVISSSGSNLCNIFYRKKYCILRFIKNMNVNIHFKPIILLFVMLMAQTVFNNSDITMLGVMKDDYEVGIYSTAYKIKRVIAQVIASICWVVMPRMSAYFEDDDWEKINAMLQKVFLVMATIGFPCIFGSAVLSDEIVKIVGGAGYEAASLPFTILMISFCFDLFGTNFLGNVVCLSSKKEKDFMEACCFAALVNIILNYVLIPIGGASAAAFTSGIAALVIMLWLLKKKEKRVKIDYIVKCCKAPLFGSVMIVFFCLIIKHFLSDNFISITIEVIGSVCLYIVIEILMKNNLAIELLETFRKRVRK